MEPSKSSRRKNKRGIFVSVFCVEGYPIFFYFQYCSVIDFGQIGRAITEQYERRKRKISLENGTRKIYTCSVRNSQKAIDRHLKKARRPNAKNSNKGDYINPNENNINHHVLIPEIQIQILYVSCKCCGRFIKIFRMLFLFIYYIFWQYKIYKFSN